MSSIRLECEIDAPRSRVYHALLDRGAVRAWMVPDGSTVNGLGWSMSLDKLARLVQDEG